MLIPTKQLHRGKEEQNCTMDQTLRRDLMPKSKPRTRTPILCFMGPKFQGLAAGEFQMSRVRQGPRRRRQRRRRQRRRPRLHGLRRRHRESLAKGNAGEGNQTHLSRHFTQTRNRRHLPRGKPIRVGSLLRVVGRNHQFLGMRESAHSRRSPPGT